MLRRIASLALLLLASWSLTTPDATAAWTTRSAGTAAQAATTMPAGPVPTVTTATVLGVGYVYTLTWPTTRVHSATPVTGYRITRTSQAGPVLGLGTCSGVTVVGLGAPAYVPVNAAAPQQSCTDIAVLPLGQVRYTVTPVYGRWTGTPSGWSPAVN